MHSDLVRAPRIDLYLKQTKFPVGRIQLSLHRVMADSFPSAWTARRHASAVNTVAADAATDGPALTLHPALYQCQVFFLDFPGRKLGSQPSMRFVAFGNYNQAAGGLVQTVHNTRPLFSAYG